MKGLALGIALFLWGVSFFRLVVADTSTVFQQIVSVLGVTNGLLMGIFVLLAGVLYKGEK